MADEPTANAYPRGLEDEFPDGPPTAVVTHRGYRLVLRFAPGDFLGEGDVQELRLLPDEESLTPKVLRRFAPQSELYLAFAHAAMRFLGPDGTPEDRWENYRGAAAALREIAGPGRGLPQEFYNQVAANYDALIAGGERHPIKALAEIHHVTIGAASRWVAEARRRGLIPEKEAVADAS